MLPWVVLGLGLELSSFCDLSGETRVLQEPLLSGRALVVQVIGLKSAEDREQAERFAKLTPQWHAKGIDFLALFPTRDFWNAPSIEELRGWNLPFPVLVGRESDIWKRGTILFIGRDGRLTASHEVPLTDPTPAFTQLLSTSTASPEPLLRHLLNGPWRDEREGWLLFFKRSPEGITFRAEEMTRWDRPTAEGDVAEGKVDIALPLVRIQGTIFRFDERTQNLLDLNDLSHRLVPGARPRLPVIDGEALVGDEALVAALKHTDALVRRETAYHAVRGLQRMEIGPGVEPWSLVQDADPECAATGAFAAGACGRSERIGELSALLDHDSAMVRRECVRALGLLGWTAEQPKLMRLAKEDLDPIVRRLAAAPPAPPPRPPQDEGSDQGADGDEPR